VIANFNPCKQSQRAAVDNHSGETFMQRRTLLTSAAVLSLPFVASRSFAASTRPGDREVLLGQSTLLSGPFATVMQSVNAGANLAFDAVNAAGGVHGRAVRIVSLDDELKPERTLINFRTLQEEHKVFGYFTALGTANIEAVIPFLHETGAPLIGGYGVADRVRIAAKGAAYIVRAGYGHEVERIVQHLLSTGVTRIGVAYLATTGGEEILANVRRALKSGDTEGELAGAFVIKLDGSNAQDAGRSMAQLKPQAVVMFLGGAPAVAFIQSVLEAGARPMFYGMSTVPGDRVARALGTRLQSGLTVAQVVPYPWSDSDPAAREYQQLAAKAHVEVNYYSYEGYFNALVLIEALQRAGRTLTRPGLHTAMRSLRARWGSMDVDFTTPGASGSKLVELVYVTPTGRYVR
jgi:branched-chain amino acid transport system substrate-binding protein